MTTAPQTDLRTWLSERVGERAGTGPVSIHASLDGLGLDSLKAIELATEVEQRLGRQLSPNLFLQYRTIDELATALEGGHFEPQAYADIFYAALDHAATSGLGYLTANSVGRDGVTIAIGERQYKSFASCSYTGIEFDERLVEGAARGLASSGAQLSYSRAYLSSPLYAELEGLLNTVFDCPVQIAQTTTLAHIAALPLLVEGTDAVLMDHQVHNSVVTAVKLLRADGIPVEVIPHNDMNRLEDKLRELEGKRKRVWYMADGIYSMFGDPAPFADLGVLHKKYPSLHLYFDDAHGMSWCGRHGRGYTLDRFPLRERMVLATSLDKAFASLGGVLVMADPQLRRKIRLCGGPMVFSGPLNPPMLGTAIASAKIHLSPELAGMQATVRENIEFCNQEMKSRQLPVIGPFDTPIRFIAIGPASVAETILRRMFGKGYLVNGSIFPAVPISRAGIRFTITRHHTKSLITSLLDELCEAVESALADHGTNIDQVYETFANVHPRGKRSGTVA